MSLQLSRRPLVRRLAAALGIALGLAASSPLAPALADQAADTQGCPKGGFESPESCSGRPLMAWRLALRNGAIAMTDGHRDEPYSFNVVESVGASPAQSEIDGRLPQGLKLEATGAVSGIPRETGVFPFTVILSDPTTVPTRVSQAYVLHVLGPAPNPGPRPAPQPRPRPASAPVPAPPPIAPPEPAPTTAGASIVIFELTAADLAALKGVTATAQAGAGASPATGAVGGPAGAPSTARPAPAVAGGPAPINAIPAAAAQPGAAPAAPARSGARPATAAQIANVPGAAVRAVGAPAAVAKAASLPADVVKRGNSLVAAFRPLTRGGARSTAPAATSPAPAAPQIVVAQPNAPAVETITQSLPAQEAQPLVTALPDDFKTRAGPVVDTAYPSRGLFKAALEKAAYEAGYRFSPALLETVADKARKVVPYGAATPPNWVSRDGCRCNPPPHSPDDKLVYGFYPFWRSAAAGPEIMFSRFNRIGLLGAQLQADGGWVYPSTPQKGADDWWDSLSPFAIIAQSHNVQLDLVLQGRDWAFLANLSPEQLRDLYEGAARKAMQLVDTPLRGRGLRNLLLPVWQEPTHVFAGVTLMFDYPPASAREYRAFKSFNDGFTRELVREMERRRKRTFALNVIAPDDVSDPEDVRNRAEVWSDFLALKHLAEPAKAHHDLPPAVAQLYVGTGNISVRLMTPLQEPTTVAKKVMRASLDTIPELKGLDRVEVQRSTVPILYLPETPFAAGKPLPRTMTTAESAQLADDLAYAKQNFGGVALWILPVRGVEADDEVYHRLQQAFFDEHSALMGTAISICSLALRLLLEFLVVLLLAGGVYYAAVGSTSGRRVTYQIILGVVAALTVVTFLVVLSLDPALERLRVGNLPFITLLVVMGAVAAWSLLKPRVPRP